MYLDVVAVNGFGAEPVLFYAPAYSGIREGSVVQCNTRFGERIGVAVSVCTISTDNPVYAVLQSLHEDQFPLRRITAFCEQLKRFVYEEDEDGEPDQV